MLKMNIQQQELQDKIQSRNFSIYKMFDPSQRQNDVTQNAIFQLAQQKMLFNKINLNFY